MSDYLSTKLDFEQVIRRTYDEEANRLRVDAEVTATIGTVEVAIDAASGDNISIANQDGSNSMVVHTDGSIDVNVLNITLDQANDSIAIGDGTNLANFNPDGSLNISDNGGSLTVDSSNLDIRNLTPSRDKVDTSGSIIALDAPTLVALESITVQNGPGAAAVNIQDGGNSLTLDIRDLVFSTDKVDVTGSIVGLDSSSLAALESITIQNGPGISAVNIQDGGNSITVDSTNFGIRNLTFATDKVDTSGSIVALDSGTLAALESITVQNPGGSSAVNIQDGGNSITVDAVGLDIRHLISTTDSVTANIKDSSGAAFSVSNPLYTSINSGGIQATVTTDNRLRVDSATPYVSHVNQVDVTSATRTINGNTASLDSYGFGMISFIINITAIAGTNPTMQISFDVSEDGTNWFELIKTVRFTATGISRLQRISLSAKYYRFRWTLTGSTPSFTFSITSTLKNYSDKRNVVVSNYSDLDLATLNAVSSIFQAGDANNISIMTIRGADGGNNGQFQVQGSNDSTNWASLSANITQGVSSTILTAFNQQSFRYYRLIVTAKTNTGTRVLDIHWGAS
jgi:hypothetical protein